MQRRVNTAEDAVKELQHGKTKKNANRKQSIAAHRRTSPKQRCNDETLNFSTGSAVQLFTDDGCHNFKQNTAWTSGEKKRGKDKRQVFLPAVPLPLQAAQGEHSSVLYKQPSEISSKKRGAAKATD